LIESVPYLETRKTSQNG